MATMDPGPWATAQAKFSRNVPLDPELADRLQDLSEEQASQSKLAYAIESGRIYGLRQMKYQMMLQRELNKMTPPTEKMW